MDSTTVIQPNLFDNFHCSNGIKIEIAAQQAGVSPATIRNWIKNRISRKR